MSNNLPTHGIPNLHDTPLSLPPPNLAAPRAHRLHTNVALSVGVAPVIAPVLGAIRAVVALGSGARVALGEDGRFGGDVVAGIALGESIGGVDSGAGDGLVDGRVDDGVGAVGALGEGAGRAEGEVRGRGALASC
jgi:hypothetical protein